MDLSLQKRIIVERIQIEEYKSIELLSVELHEDINILVGGNGSGKSNFLSAINETYLPENTEIAPYRSVKLDLKASTGEQIRLELSRLQMRVMDIATDETFSISQKLYINGKFAFHNVGPDDTTLGLGYVTNLKVALSNLKLSFWRKPLFVNFNLPKHLAIIDEPGLISVSLKGEGGIRSENQSTNFITGIIDRISFDKEFLYLDHDLIDRKVLLAHLTIEEKVKDNLRKFSPIKDIRFNENINIYRTDKQTIVENLKLDFLVSGNWLPWSQLSDGTKRLFYIMSEITVNEGRLILIEEPELGIHPHQLDLFMTFLKEQSRFSQMIISTHSPSALNHFSKDQLDRILLVSNTPKRGTRIERLSDEKIKKADLYIKEVGSLSDYWLMSDLEE